MYRHTPIACDRCGEFIERHEADVVASGYRCWRCAMESQIAEHTLRQETAGPMVRSGLAEILDILFWWI